MSMKYLLSFIDALPDPQDSKSGLYGNDHLPPRHHTSVPKFKHTELKQLLTEAKEGLEIKNTTHEFFETLERITNELRGMTEHSTAFLSRVRKADAPDYFNIIKNPMDLGTVLKKVKAQQYKEKKAFKADLDLIWDNCLLYNTLPSHPLRRSANILRNRANHLLEFVTDPATPGSQPVLHRAPGSSNLKSGSSRLDALDASHVINSTIGSISKPNRGDGDDVQSMRSGSILQQDVENENEQTMIDGAESLESDYDDFQDYDDDYDEEDESIKTRKGLVSLKTQPGGGRNLELLKGLAAQSATSESGDLSMGDGMSPTPTMDLDRDRSRSPSVRSTAGTPAPASQSAIPDLPGTVPGQGSALVARRATANFTYGHRDRRKPRTPSVPPQPSRISFPDRPAILRTAESMAKFAELSSDLFSPASAASHDSDTTPTPSELYTKAVTPIYRPSVVTTAANTLIDTSNEIEASALLVPLTASTVAAQQVQDQPGPSSPQAFHLQRTRSKIPAPHIEDPDLLWWQAVTSDSLMASGLPEVPFASTSSAVPEQQPERWNAERLNPSTSMVDHEGSESPNSARSNLLNDLQALKRIRRLHRKMSVLKESPIASPNSSDDEDELSDEEYASKSSPKRGQGKKGFLEYPVELFHSSMASRSGSQAIHEFCGSILRHVGFDGIQRSALDSISSLVTQYLLNIGQTMTLYRDRFSHKVKYGSIITQALAENLVVNDKSDSAPTTPLGRLEKYIECEVPSYSERISSLARRLEEAYIKELEEGIESEPAFRIDESRIGEESTDEDGSSLDPLLRVLCSVEADHLKLHAIGIDKETGFTQGDMYTNILRQICPDAALDGALPFNPPPAFVPITKACVSSQIGLLQPFLMARQITPYELYPDDSLPVSNGIADEAKRMIGLSRPEVTVSTGRILLGKRKREFNLVGLGTHLGGPNGASSAAPISGAVSASLSASNKPAPALPSFAKKAKATSQS